MQACRAEQCHHNITNGTLDFSVLLPPPYYREIWDYKNASADSIQEVISIFSCPKALTNKNKKILIKNLNAGKAHGWDDTIMLEVNSFITKVVF